MSKENLKGATKHKDRFINPHAKQIRRTFLDVLLWKTGFYDDPRPAQPMPEDFVYPMPEKPVDERAPRVLWINHSTYLIKVMGLTFLTDPIWSNRCSPLRYFGPKRRHNPALKIEDLGSIDYVLISHNHYDHLDKKSVLKLFKHYPSITWLVPEGVKAWFVKLGITNVFELSWWEQISLFSKTQKEVQLHFSAVPCQHFAGRKVSDLNKTLWVSWVVECVRQKEIKRFYFVGDTGYNAYDFKAVGQKWKYMDLSMIPIGSYSPRIFMSPVHIEPADAVKIHKEVGSRLSVAMHWKTFRLSDEGMERPPYDLYLTLQNEKISPLSFLAPQPGYEINW